MKLNKENVAFISGVVPLMVRLAKPWNNLPRKVVEARYLTLLTTKLGRALENML